MNGPIRLVLADDHHVVRQAIRTLLETDPGLKVVGEVADGLRVEEVVRRANPDVLVVDLIMPGLGGMEVARQIRRKHPRVKILILSVQMSDAHVFEAMKIGVLGYVRKDASASELIAAIRAVAQDQTYLSQPFTQEAVEIYRKRAEVASADPYDTLTGREREVFHLVAEGLNNVEIAERLGISPRTVESHRTNMMEKLQFRRVTDVVRDALRRGVLSLD